MSLSGEDKAKMGVQILNGIESCDSQSLLNREFYKCGMVKALTLHKEFPEASKEEVEEFVTSFEE